MSHVQTNNTNSKDYPKLYKIQQKFNNAKIDNIEEEIIKELNSINGKYIIKPGMRIAITAGSRGISNIALIIKAICSFVKENGAEPIVIPAMGSHGGATAEGQENVLKKLGITEEAVGAPIVSSMEVVELGKTSNGSPVYMDENAYKSDGIILVNRVKPHTDFIGDTESGLLKMISVGLGKEKGASAMHGYGLASTIPSAAKIALEKAPILMGMAILENSKDETYKIKALLPEYIEKEEKELFKEAKNLVPKIPTDKLDILIVEEMGKMFSGTGMDTKVIGRMMVFGEEEPESPSINKVVVLNLSEASHGNALGIGLADITTKKLVDSIDYEEMYANLLATTFLERGKIPVTMANDEKAIESAFKTIGSIKPTCAKLAIIKNTLNLKELYVTESVLNEINKDKIKILEQGIEIKFDQEGNINL